MTDDTQDITLTSRPALTVQTVYFDQRDRADAGGLARELYDLLTRRIDDRLEFGPGIPVFGPIAYQDVELEAAANPILIPVFGSSTFPELRNLIAGVLDTWSATVGKACILPLATFDRWSSRIDDVLTRSGELLRLDGKMPSLYISHAVADAGTTADAAATIFEYASNHADVRNFFKEIVLFAGEPLTEDMHPVDQGVLLAIRSDTYGSRTWCQHELLTAKLNRLPTLVVEVLQRGERRSSPYGGNGPALLWNKDAADVVFQARVEWLRAQFFKHEAARLVRDAKLPESTITLTRPPELLDLVQGPLSTVEPQLVMHPDPELSVHERAVLRKASSRLRLVTPNTAFRRVLTKSISAAEVPLTGIQVALSLSDRTDVGEGAELAPHHLIDVVTQLARTLVSSGVAVAYGGDLRTNGFTRYLIELIQTHNQTALAPADLLHCYLHAKIDDFDLQRMPLNLHSLARDKQERRLALLKPPTPGDEHHDALYVSDMRQVLARQIDAAVAIGGQSEPWVTSTAMGYLGRYPGIIEEAWRILVARKPLYVVGGFGGAAALLADLLDGCAVPDRLRDATWLGSPTFAAVAAAVDDDPARIRLGLPRRMEDLAEEVRRQGAKVLHSDETSIKWNGLSISENRQLFRTRDIVAVTSLVMKGLLARCGRPREQGLQIELVHGSITDATELDAVAVAAFDDVPLGGAGAALDRTIGRLASEKRRQGQTLISVKDTNLDADWLYLASLGRLSGQNPIAAVELAARGTAEAANRHGLERIGIVAFGGTAVEDLDQVVAAMLAGLRAAQSATFVWFEADKARFHAIHDLLKNRRDVKLSTRVIPQSAQPADTAASSLILHLRYQGDSISATILPPSGNAVVKLVSRNMNLDEFRKYSNGVGQMNRATPPFAHLQERGADLAHLLFEGQIGKYLDAHQDARLVIIHDEASAALPFETLRTLQETSSVKRPFHRLLSTEGVPIDHTLGRPTKRDRLKVLLIANPTDDLDGAALEATAIQNYFEAQPQRFEVVALVGAQATKHRVLDELPSADLMHYCGHAVFEKPGDQSSGLYLTAKVLLTQHDLRERPVPRIVMMNACQSGQVQTDGRRYDAASFAGFFLRGGVEAYVGTLWEVLDAAATNFAQTVYQELFAGRTLETAVRAARSRLYAEGTPDWANYLLYGDGRFVLMEPQTKP